MNPSTALNVWLCDDDKDDHYVFAEALRQVQPLATLAVFQNGSELLQELSNHLPDVLFLDINMPRVNGLEALQQIRAQPALQKLPIVMYSVSEQDSDITASYDYGAVIYLVKPQLYPDLVMQLKAIFELERTEPGFTGSLHFDGEKLIPFSKTSSNH